MAEQKTNGNAKYGERKEQLVVAIWLQQTEDVGLLQEGN